jgi:hypothetical protein
VTHGRVVEGIGSEEMIVGYQLVLEEDRLFRKIIKLYQKDGLEVVFGEARERNQLVHVWEQFI